MQAPATFRFDDGAAYERSMGRWSALVAAPFLDWLALPPGQAWLDAGCGTGSFTEVLLARQAPAAVVGIDPEAAQLAIARERVDATGVRFEEGDAQALPLADGSVDAAVMALVLFFVPDPARGVAELVRVVRPGGMVAAYHWDTGGVPLHPILDVARAEGYAALGPPSRWVASAAASAALWHGAGLAEVQAVSFEVRRTFDTFEDYWRTAQGSSRLRDFLAGLAQPALQRLRERVREGLDGARCGPCEVRARATAVKGRKR